MGFLKKAGSILGKITQLWLGFAPMLTNIPGAVRSEISSDLTILAGIIVNAEAMGQALGIAGPEKLKAAAPLVGQMMLQSSLLAHRKIKDPVLFLRGSTKIGDGMADVLNALDDDIDDVKDKA